MPDIGTCLKLKRKPEKARDNRIRPRSCARPRSRRTACRTAVGRCDEALRAPAVRAFVDVMHESWLFFLNAGKSHFPGGHATTEKVTGLRGAPPRERIARNPHCQIPRRCSQFFLSIAASMSHNIPSIVSTGCAKRRRQGGQKGRWCAKSTGPARVQPPRQLMAEPVPTRWRSLAVPRGLVTAYALATKCRTHRQREQALSAWCCVKALCRATAG